MRGASVVMIAVLTAVAACASPPPAPPPPPAPTSQAPDPRAVLNDWVTGFCRLDDALSSALFQPSPVLSLAPTEADRRSVIDNLNKTSALFTRAREISARLDPAPTTAAKDLLTRYRQQLDESAAHTAGEATSLAQQPLANLNVLSRVFSLRATVYQGQTSSMVTDAKNADPALKDAFATASACWLYRN